MIEKIVGDTYKQYGLLGLIVLLLGAVIVYLIKDNLKDREAKKEVEKKKEDGTYHSWESMNERLRGMETKINGHAEEIKEHKKEYASHMVVENLEEGRFVKLESNADHLKENISDIKENIAEIKRDLNQGFSIMADIKTALIQISQKGH